MNDRNTLPGCFSLRKPIPPNSCENCPVKDDCQKYVAKAALKTILIEVEGIQEILRGER